MKGLIWLFICISLALSVLTLSRLLFTADLPDFRAYHEAVLKVVKRNNPYTLSIDQYPYIYPPTSLLWLIPFSLLPTPIAENIWLVLSFALLITSIVLILKVIKEPLKWQTVLLILGFAMLSFPTKFTLGMGQINILLLFLISLVFYAFQTSRRGWAGVFLAIAVSIKLTPILLLIFLIRKKSWQNITTFCLTTLVLISLSVVLMGWGLTKQYWLEIFPSIPIVGNAVYYNQSLTGFLARSGITNQKAGLLNYVILGGLVVISWLCTRLWRQQPLIELLEYSLLIITILITGGLAWQHHLVVLLIPFIAIGMYLHRQNKLFSYLGGLLFVAYVLISYNIKQPSQLIGAASIFLSHATIGMVLLFGLIVMQLKSSFSKQKKVQSG